MIDGLGNVTRNPQLSRTHGGTPIVNLTLAENHRRQVEGKWVRAGDVVVVLSLDRLVLQG